MGITDKLKVIKTVVTIVMALKEILGADVVKELVKLVKELGIVEDKE